MVREMGLGPIDRERENESDRQIDRVEREMEERCIYKGMERVMVS